MQTLTENKTQNKIGGTVVSAGLSPASFHNPTLTENQKTELKNLTCQLIDIRYACAALQLNYLGHLIDMATTEAEIIAGPFISNRPDNIK